MAYIGHTYGYNTEIRISSIFFLNKYSPIDSRHLMTHSNSMEIVDT